MITIFYRSNAALT